MDFLIIISSSFRIKEFGVLDLIMSFAWELKLHKIRMIVNKFLSDFCKDKLLNK